MANEIPQSNFQLLAAALAAEPPEKVQALYDAAREGLRADPERSEEQVELQATQIVKAIIWLEQKWTVGRQCPYCENPQWEIGTPVEIATGVIPLSQLSPAFPVMCTNCGNTVLINAIRAGIVPEPRQS